MIEHEQFSAISVNCHGAKWYNWPHIFNIWKMKWYFSNIPVSFNFLVIGIDSFDKNILKIL